MTAREARKTGLFVPTSWLQSPKNGFLIELGQIDLNHATFQLFKACPFQASYSYPGIKKDPKTRLISSAKLGPK